MLAAIYAFQDRLGRPCAGAYLRRSCRALDISSNNSVSVGTTSDFFQSPHHIQCYMLQRKSWDIKYFSNARELHLHYYQFDVVSAIYVICMFSFLVCAVSPILLGLVSQAAAGHWSYRRRRLVKMSQGKTDAYVLVLHFGVWLLFVFFPLHFPEKVFIRGFFSLGMPATCPK